MAGDVLKGFISIDKSRKRSEKVVIGLLVALGGVMQVKREREREKSRRKGRAMKGLEGNRMTGGSSSSCCCC